MVGVDEDAAFELGTEEETGAAEDEDPDEPLRQVSDTAETLAYRQEQAYSTSPTVISDDPVLPYPSVDTIWYVAAELGLCVNPCEAYQL